MDGPSAPAALILPTAQNAVALVAEPSPLIRKVNEWLQTVSPLARSYILLNTPNDGPARRRGTRDPTGSQGVCRPARACLEASRNTGATVPYSARVSQASTNSHPVILQTEIPSNTARLQRGSRDGPAPFIYKTAYNAEFAGKFTAKGAVNSLHKFSPRARKLTRATRVPLTGYRFVRRGRCPFGQSNLTDLGGRNEKD